MNTHRIHQIRTATFTSVVAFIACASIASPASAGETHDNGEGGGSGPNSVSPFAVPIAALDGLMLSQYVQNHHAGNPRLATPWCSERARIATRPPTPVGGRVVPDAPELREPGGAGGARTHDPRIMSPLL